MATFIVSSTGGSQSVDLVLTMHLIDSETDHPVPTRLSYDLDRPLEVTATFDSAGSEVRWTFSRDLLLDGTFAPTGTGDVRVWPCLDARGAATVVLELCVPHQQVLVEAPSATIVRFLRATLDLVPRGLESAHLDLDALVDALLTD